MLKINRILLLLGTLLLAGAVAVSLAACDTSDGGATDTTEATPRPLRKLPPRKPPPKPLLTLPPRK